MTILYEWPPTRSQRAKWVLEEAGVEYDSRKVDMMAGEQKSDAYRAVHPLGVVPALQTETYRMFESVAIVMQVIDEHPQAGLAPAPGSPERAAYYQWNVFAAAEVDPALMMYFDNALRPEGFLRPPATRHEPVMAERGRYDFSVRAEILSEALINRDYMLGDAFSGADIVIGHSCFMAEHMQLLADHPVLQVYLDRLKKRPAYRRAYAGC